MTLKSYGIGSGFVMGWLLLALTSPAQNAVLTKDSFADNPVATAPAIPVLVMQREDVHALGNLSDAQLNALVELLDATPAVPANQLPLHAVTFYSLQHPEWPPLPGNTIHRPAWPMDGGYLLNDVGYDYDHPQGPRSKIASLAPGSSGDGGDGTNVISQYGSSLKIDTSLLWLEITNVFSGLAYLNLHHATNQVYAIWSTTNLLSDWNVEQELWPTNGVAMPFTVPTYDRPNLFLRAQDWTGVDSDADALPDWWEWHWFGNCSLSGTNLDANGNTLLTDYQSNLDPNPISFTVRLGNRHFNSTNVSGSYLVLSGVPSYAAVLVNNTNFNAAVWTNYNNTNLMFNLGNTDGVYQVWFGLKGPATNAQVSWFGTAVYLDRVAPAIFLTSPTTNLTASSLAQVIGGSSEELLGVTYDLSNAVVQLVSQSGYKTGHFVDTNAFAISTNYFQCYDLPLTNGLNRISVHATDLAGNVTTTNLNLTLDYSLATNPVIALAWPQDGLVLCGSNFTVRGWTADAGSTVTATISDNSGNTNFTYGVVERSGTVWAEGLPLSSGTNAVTVTVMNAAGLSNSTNFNVVKGDMTLTLTAIDGDLWLPTVNVSGTVSDPNAAVWVNGVEAFTYGDGTWVADAVPVSAGGMASFEVTADAGAGAMTACFVQAKPSEVVLAAAQWNNDDFISGSGGTSLMVPQSSLASVASSGSSLIHRTEMGCFAFGQGGLIHQTLATLNTNRVVTYTRWIDSVLSRDGLLIVSIHITDSLGRDEVVGGGAYAIALAQGELHAPSVGTNAGWNKQAQTTMNLLTGGNQPVRQLYQLTASATEQLPTAPFIAPIPPEDLTVADQPLTTDGAAYQSFPGNASAEVTPVASASSYNHPPPTATIYNLTVNGNGQPLSQLQPYAPTFCVGQNLTFSSSLPSLPPGFKAMTGIQWKLEGTYVNAATNAVPGKTFPDCSINYYFDPNPNLLTNSTVQGWWTSGSAPELYRVSVNCTLVFTNGTTASAQSGDFYFGMQRPNSSLTSVTTTNIPPVQVITNSDHFVEVIYGQEQLTKKQAGIYFTFSVATSAIGSSNEFAYLQIIDSTTRLSKWTNGTPRIKSGTKVLDSFMGNYLWGHSYIDANSTKTNYFADSPGQAAIENTPDGRHDCKWISCNDGFSGYLIFRPPGNDSIWVTLKKMQWSWSGGSTKANNGNWTLDSGYPSPPVNPMGTDSSEFPFWKIGSPFQLQTMTGN